MVSASGLSAINLNFVPPGTTVELRLYNIGEYALIDDIHLTYDRVVYHTICDNSADYRFGFNGQEKDNEVAGIGNFTTAMFWEYDSRIGRRWNVDPIVHVWESPYATFSNNPILFLDPKGDEFVNAHDKEKKTAEGDVSQAKERKESLRGKLDDLKSIDPSEKSKGHNKQIRRLERQVKKADRALGKAENRLTEVQAKWDEANATLEEFKVTNPALYGQWDRRPEKIVVGITFSQVRMENSMGQTTGYTDEGTDIDPTKKNTTEVMAIIQLYAPYSTVVTNAQTQSQIEGNVANLVHALGHINNYVFGAAEDTESNANAYERENYWDIKTKNK